MREVVMCDEDNFNKLVACAEEYIVTNAEKILIAARIAASEEKIDKIKKEIKESEEKNIKLKEENKKLKKLKEYVFLESGENNIRCKNLLASYKPMCDKVSEIDFDKILKRFCIELQNYQAMPKAINYDSYYKNDGDNTDIDENSNEIYKTVNEFYNDKNIKWAEIANLKEKEEKKDSNVIPTYYYELYKTFKSKKDFGIEEKKVYLKLDKTGTKWYKDAKQNKQTIEKYAECNNIEEVFTKDNNVLRHNYAWDKYSHGLMDVLLKLQSSDKLDYIKCIKGICSKSDEYYETPDDNTKFNELQTDIENFHKNIFSISDTLSYDFLKELYCQKLIKDDVHILECWKHCVNEKANIKLKKEKKEIVKSFIKFCKKYDNKKNFYTPYYIDKLLWLCSTGNFYDDGIIITKMGRANFFKYFDEYRKRNR